MDNASDRLGDVQEGARLEIQHLIREVAYEHWYRMLFALFLAENNLLIEPEMGIAITMDECEELAREAAEDPRAMAAHFAGEMGYISSDSPATIKKK